MGAGDQVPFAVVRGEGRDCYVVINGSAFVFQHIDAVAAGGIAHVYVADINLAAAQVARRAAEAKPKEPPHA